MHLNSHSADYVIVGGGVAGCVLASQILRRQLGTVLLIEAGGPPTSPLLKIPFAYPRAFHGPNSWRYQSISQPSLAQRKMHMPSGKTLGGSSSINALIYLRPHPSDFQFWPEACHADWNSEAVEIAFEEMEQRCHVLEFAPPPLHPALQAFSDVCGQQLNLPVHSSLLTPRIGLGPFRRCQAKGRRLSAWHLWLKPYVNSPSLKILTHAPVQRLVIQRDRVVGVQTVGDSSDEPSIRANRNVILCAGAIQSPRLLMESGIGDSERLKAIGIAARIDLPQVGQNLQDHLLFPITHSLQRFATLPSQASPQERLEYARHRTGPKASNIAELGAFWNLTPPQQDRLPDFQWHVTPTHYLEYPTRQPPTPALSMGISLCRPRSRGQLSLVPSSDGSHRYELQIDPAYLHDPEDAKELVDAIQKSRQWLAHECWNGLLGEELLPGSKRSEAPQVETILRRLANTLYHYAGTCAMGSVVDSRFRVRQTEGLHVCDGSAMPTLVSGNPQATIMLMAYRLGQWLS